jgi:hypothetical protein
MAKLSTAVLLRKRFALLRAIERDQGKVAEIETELRSRGVEPSLGTLPRRPRLPLFRYNELPRLVLTVLWEAQEPLHIRDITRAVLVRKHAALTDPKLFLAVLKRVRDVLGMYRPRGTERMPCGGRP